MERIALGLALLVAWAGFALAQPSEAYVNQVDRSARGSVATPGAGAPRGGAYIMQLPESARPLAPRPVQRRAPRVAAAPVAQGAPVVEASARGPVFPNVGSGVALALSQATGARAFPDVGAGVGAP